MWETYTNYRIMLCNMSKYKTKYCAFLCDKYSFYILFFCNFFYRYLCLRVSDKYYIPSILSTPLKNLHTLWFSGQPVRMTFLDVKKISDLRNITNYRPKTKYQKMNDLRRVTVITFNVMCNYTSIFGV